MNDKEEYLIRIDSLEKMKNEVLIKHLNEINLDEELDLYDKVVKYFALSELDTIYNSKILESFNDNDKNNVLSIIHKYQDLCFYDKNKEYWIDSVDGVPVSDYNLILYQILENFDFLTNIYLNNGEDSLKLLSSYDKCEYFDNSLSIVESIKRNFINDEVLLEVLKEISKEDSLYSIFTDNEKMTLLTYAEGTLYFYGKEDVKITNPIFLAVEIYSRLNSNQFSISCNDEFLKVASNLSEFFKDEDGFNKVVEDMYYEYQEKIISDNNFNNIDFYLVNKDLNGDYSKKIWNIQSDATYLNVETPYSNTKVNLQR